MRKPLPPYARSAQVASDSVWIRCGFAGWNHMRRNPQCGEIVWPGDMPPDEHDWSFVDGLGCYVVRGALDNWPVRLLADELLFNGATHVDIVDWGLFGTDIRGLVSFYPEAVSA